LLIGAAYLGRGLGVEAHAMREMVDLPGRLGERLALLGCEGRGKFARVLVNQLRGFEEDRRSPLDIGSGPGCERALGGRHRQLDVLRTAGRNAVDDGLRGGVHDLELIACRRLAPLASNQHLGHAGSSPAGLTSSGRDYSLPNVSQVSYVDSGIEELAPRTDGQVQAHLIAGKLVE